MCPKIWFPPAEWDTTARALPPGARGFSASHLALAIGLFMSGEAAGDGQEPKCSVQ
jgi:hypothetical protein